jgi:hypothetical protein
MMGFRRHYERRLSERTPANTPGVFRGTDSSNPAPSSRESRANRTSGGKFKQKQEISRQYPITVSRLEPPPDGEVMEPVIESRSHYPLSAA